MKLLSPDAVLEQISAALPDDCRQNVIIVGSLAAGYYFFAGNGEHSIRTKDVDCMFSPHAKAVAAAGIVTERLLKAQWEPKDDGEWGQPGSASTPDDLLPMIRLKPPGERGGEDWFLELLGAPDEQTAQTKTFHRVQTQRGHYAICSFNYLALAEWRPIDTWHGLRIARPEMMALANMLHHPDITTNLIAGTQFKRSNKDLGRVLTLAFLAARNKVDLDFWAQSMALALKERFPIRAKELAISAGAGIRKLMSSEGDKNQALMISNMGLLASLDVDREMFDATGRRFIQSVIEPLEEEAAGW